jgi:hypothetical protein
MTLPKGYSAEKIEAQRKKNEEIEAQRNAKFEKKMFFIFFIFYALVLLPPLIAPYLKIQPTFLPSSIVVVVGIATIFVVYQQRKSDADKSLPKRDTTGSLFVLAGIYAIVASFAITEALAVYSEALAFTDATIRSPMDLITLLGTNYNYFTTTFLVLTFFSMAGTSYLGTTFFLSHEADRPENEIKSDLQKFPRIGLKRKGSEAAAMDGTSGKTLEAVIAGTRGLFFTFILSFVQGTFLFYGNKHQ